MSYEYKELIEQAIIDDNRPLDWEEGFKELDEVYSKAKAYDKYLETRQRELDKIKRKVHTNDNFTYKDVSAYIAYNDTVKELESYRK